MAPAATASGAIGASAPSPGSPPTTGRTGSPQPRPPSAPRRRVGSCGAPGPRTAAGLAPAAARTRPTGAGRTGKLAPSRTLGVRSPAALVALALFGVLGAGCTQGVGDSVSRAGDSTVVGDARFEEGECRFEAPEDVEVRCGWLVVPEDRARPDGRQVRLHVGVFHRAGADARPDPVVFLEGGPGGNALEGATSDFLGRFGLYAEDRDVIVFDQRGTGYSEPALDCPELRETWLAQLDVDLSADAALAESREALGRCRERLLAEDVDLTAYHSEASAADVADLRRVLGYESWNVLGVSYGTRLAQTLLRTAPEGIRSVLLDSTYPVAVDGVAELPDRMAESFDRLLAACEADAACSTRYPTLGARFTAQADRLEHEPLEVTVDVEGERRPALVDGAGLRDLVFLSLYEAGLARAVPRMVEELEAGRADVVAKLAAVSAAQLGGVSLGLHTSVQCHDEVPFADRAKVEDGPRRHPELAESIAGQLVDGPGAFETCASWGAGHAPPVEDEPVRSDVPALVVGGELDPVTPLSWGEEVAMGFDRARFVAYPGLGHGVAAEEGCPAAVTTAFLGDPAAFVSSPGATACASTMPPIRLAAPAAGEIELVPFDADLGGVTVSGERPADWDELQPGVVVRQHDLLDPTGLVTLAAPGAGTERLLGALRFDGEPRPTGSRPVGDVAWSLYEAEADGAPVDIALAEVDGVGLLVALFSAPTEREGLRGAVLEPALDSLRSS
ncbi:MAG: alpha/beta fold hydrolase [Acidimicrobiia bacterium]|nr:alpha/beta fold hydrolase [Acidimicrobiia bacterium]